MATMVEQQTSLHELADDVLHRLVNDVNETSGLSVLDGDHVLVVARVACKNQLRIAQPIGTRNPIYCTAAGKALLAHQSPERIEEIISLGMPQRTDLTITNPEAMRTELARIRDQGYALDLGEREVGLIGISVPVRNASGAVVATCTASGSGARIDADRIPLIRDRVAVSAAEISERLGWTSGDSIDTSRSNSSKGVEEYGGI
jgi:DNA-binding IclR family transcriptional regulator